MKRKILSEAQAKFKLFIWNKEAEGIKSHELFSKIKELNLPEETIVAFQALMQKSIRIGGKFLAIGKIIIVKLLEFVEKNFFLVAGLGIGFVIGGAIAGFIASIHIPFIMQAIAPILASIAKFFQISIPLIGAVAGHNIDTIIPNLGKSIVEVAKEFFQLFAEILNIVLDKEEAQTNGGFSPT